MNVLYNVVVIIDITSSYTHTDLHMGFLGEHFLQSHDLGRQLNHKPRVCGTIMHLGLLRVSE